MTVFSLTTPSRAINAQRGLETPAVLGGKITVGFIAFLAFRWLECLHGHLYVEWLSWSLGFGNLLKAWHINSKNSAVFRKISSCASSLLLDAWPVFGIVCTTSVEVGIRSRNRIRVKQKNKTSRNCGLEKALSLIVPSDLWSFSILPVGRPVWLLFSGSKGSKGPKTPTQKSTLWPPTRSLRCSWTLHTLPKWRRQDCCMFEDKICSGFSKMHLLYCRKGFYMRGKGEARFLLK